MIREPIVFTIRQPPIAVPSAMAMCAARMTQRGMWSAVREMEMAEDAGRVDEVLLTGHQQPDDDSHGLLGVVGAVTQRVERRREELEPAEARGPPVLAATGTGATTAQPSA